MLKNYYLSSSPETPSPPKKNLSDKRPQDLIDCKFVPKCFRSSVIGSSLKPPHYTDKTSLMLIIGDWNLMT